MKIFLLFMGIVTVLLFVEAFQSFNKIRTIVPTNDDIHIKKLGTLTVDEAFVLGAESGVYCVFEYIKSSDSLFSEPDEEIANRISICVAIRKAKHLNIIQN